MAGDHDWPARCCCPDGLVEIGYVLVRRGKLRGLLTEHGSAFSPYGVRPSGWKSAALVTRWER